MHDETPCKAYAQDCSFTSYGVQIESDAGKIKADNATSQKSQKLLYRGTGNIQFRFFIYQSIVEAIGLTKKENPQHALRIFLCPEQESNLHYLSITRF